MDYTSIKRYMDKIESIVNDSIKNDWDRVKLIKELQLEAIFVHDALTDNLLGE